MSQLKEERFMQAKFASWTYATVTVYCKTGLQFVILAGQLYRKFSTVPTKLRCCICPTLTHLVIQLLYIAHTRQNALEIIPQVDQLSFVLLLTKTKMFSHHLVTFWFWTGFPTRHILSPVLKNNPEVIDHQKRNQSSTVCNAKLFSPSL